MAQLSFWVPVGSLYCFRVGFFFGGVGGEGADMCLSRQPFLTPYNEAIKNHHQGSDWEHTGTAQGKPCPISEHQQRHLRRVHREDRKQHAGIDSSSGCNVFSKVMSPFHLPQPITGHLPEGGTLLVVWTPGKSPGEQEVVGLAAFWWLSSLC